jgi:hypothetical protein
MLRVGRTAAAAKPIYAAQAGTDYSIASLLINCRTRDVRFTPESGHCRPIVGCPLCAKSRHYDCHAEVLAFEGLIHLGAITAYLTRIKYVDLQKCYRVKLGEALPWCYPASCSSGQTLGGASLIWAKAQQSSRFFAPGPTSRRRSEPSLTRQIKLGDPGSFSSRISDVSTSVSSAGAAVSLCAAFFAGVRLGLALATARLAALATLRGLPRLADFPLGSFPRFCTFDFFLRLAIIVPWSGWCFPRCQHYSIERPKRHAQMSRNLHNGVASDCYPGTPLLGSLKELGPNTDCWGLFLSVMRH